ncbi:ATP-binding protein [Actinoplanes sp. CA-054009]
MDDPARIDVVSGGTVRVVLAGAIVMVRHDDVLSQVETAIKGAPGGRVDVDLGGATAMDSSGVALLILLRRLATRSRAEFRVRGVPLEIFRHLEIAGLTSLFGLEPPDDPGPAETGEPAEAVVPILDEPFDRHSIRTIRDRLSTYATSCGLVGFDRYKLLLAATEIMANAVFHGGGRGVIDVERHGDRLIIRIADQGPGIPRRHRTESARPRPGRIGSAGLWLARQVCERVDIHTGPGGTTVLLTYVMPSQPG